MEIKSTAGSRVGEKPALGIAYRLDPDHGQILVEQVV
jgi:hypothetical protein